MTRWLSLQDGGIYLGYLVTIGDEINLNRVPCGFNPFSLHSLQRGKGIRMHIAGETCVRRTSFLLWISSSISPLDGSVTSPERRADT